MPRVTKSVARADIYSRGLRTLTTENKQGFKLDRSKPADEKDFVIVPKGTTYYSWAFAFSPKQISLTFPKPQQLTRSEFYTQVYDFNDELSSLSEIVDVEDLQSTRDDIVQRIHDFAEEQEDNRSNMPDGLQDGDTGQLLEERYEAIENWANELEGVDLDFDGDDEIKREDYETEEDYDEARADYLDEWLLEKTEELQSISCEI